MARTRSRFWWCTGISLLLAAALSVPLAVFVNTVIQRHQVVRGLVSANDADREEALNALIQRGPNDPELVNHVMEAIPSFDAEEIVQTYNALIAAGLADDDRVIGAIAAALPAMPHEQFTKVAQLLEAHGKSSDPRIVDEAIRRIGELRRERDRFTEIFVLLDNAGAWKQPTIPGRVWARWVRYGLDAEDADARAAALSRLSALNDLSDIRGLFRVINLAVEDESPKVRLMLLKVLAPHALHNSYFRQDLDEAVQDPDPEVAAFAQRVTSLLDGEAAPPIEPQHVGTPLESITTDQLITCWREVLDLPLEGDTLHWLESIAHTDAPSEQQLPLVLAATYRLGRPLNLDAPEPNEDQWKRALAALEGNPRNSVEVAFHDDLPHLLRPAIFRVATEPDPAWLMATFRLDGRSAVRDQACLAAATRLSTEQLDALIATLLEDYDPEGRMSAALIAGLTGRQSQLLHKTLGNESRFAVQRLLMVGLWMQGLMPELEATVAGMLSRPDLPTSTLLLAMLDSPKKQTAIDQLLGSPAAPGWDDARLVELLGRQRFGQVLSVYLPDTAPPLELWADGERFLDQLVELRTWNLLHRLD